MRHEIILLLKAACNLDNYNNAFNSKVENINVIYRAIIPLAGCNFFRRYHYQEIKRCLGTDIHDMEPSRSFPTEINTLCTFPMVFLTPLELRNLYICILRVDTVYYKFKPVHSCVLLHLRV